MYLEKYISPESQSMIQKLIHTMFHYIGVTFSQRSYSFGPANREEIISFPILVSYFSGTGTYDVSLRVNNNPDPLPSKLFVKINYYIIAV